MICFLIKSRNGQVSRKLSPVPPTSKMSAAVVCVYNGFHEELEHLHTMDNLKPVLIRGQIVRGSSSKSSVQRPGWVEALIVVSLLLSSSSAFGALGGTLDSVEVDRSRLMAKMTSTDVHGYTVHAMTTPTGTVIREYVSSSGRVFGVAWEGPFMPDFRQLLGSYFSHFSAATKAKRQSHASRNLLNIQESGIVVVSSGHMRAYSGHAYDPGLLPEGVDGNEVR